MKEIVKKYSLFILIGIMILASILTNYIPSKQIEHTQPNTKTYPTVEYIYVDIKGQVYNPGVYKIEKSMRLYQLVNLAGGLTSDADSLSINLSYKLFDEDIIYIPSIHDDLDNPELVIPQTKERLDINQASSEQLQTLPGIGPSTAQKIIDYRNEIGYFEDIEDIKNVQGIGESTFENIKDSIKT